LVRNISSLFKNNLWVYFNDPKKLMIDAMNSATKFGSSTAVICTLDKLRPILYGVNLGDSGYLIFRF